VVKFAWAAKRIFDARIHGSALIQLSEWTAHEQARRHRRPAEAAGAALETLARLKGNRTPVLSR
jgi:hypothetical protein